MPGCWDAWLPVRMPVCTVCQPAQFKVAARRSQAAFPVQRCPAHTRAFQSNGLAITYRILPMQGQADFGHPHSENGGRLTRRPV